MSTMYQRIYEYYKTQILEQTLKSGQKMPTEQEIGTAFNASRITVRHALQHLVNDGLIYKIQGKGTYVSGKKDSMQLNYLLGFTAEMKTIGKEPSTIVLGVKLTDPNEKVSKKLNLHDGQKIYVIERIRMADNVKVALEKVSIPFSLVPNIDKENLEKSLYNVLSKKYQIEPKFARETLEATFADQRVAELLEIKQKSPVLAIERLTYDKNENIFEYTESVYRGDKYKFTVNIEV